MYSPSPPILGGDCCQAPASCPIRTCWIIPSSHTGRCLAACGLLRRCCRLQIHLEQKHLLLPPIMFPFTYAQSPTITYFFEWRSTMTILRAKPWPLRAMRIWLFCLHNLHDVAFEIEGLFCIERCGVIPGLHQELQKAGPACRCRPRLRAACGETALAS